MRSNKVIRPSFTRQSYTVLPGGNAVRKAEVKESWQEKEQRERQEERRRRWEKQIRRRAIQKEFKERRARSSVFSLKEACAIGVLAVFFLAACVFYLSQFSAENQSTRALSSLKSQYSRLVEDNNAESSRIEGSIDHDEIYRYVTEELGMAYPEKGQTVGYKRSESSFVKQAEEIPQ